MQCIQLLFSNYLFEKDTNMKKVAHLCFALICTLTGNLLAQQSLGMEVLAQWKVDTLPVKSGLSYNDIWGYSDCGGREYAILGSTERVHFFDLKLPSAPVEVGSFTGGNRAIWRDMKTYHDRAYSVCDGCSEGLMVFDLSKLPSSVSKTLQDKSAFTSCHNIFIDESKGRLYAAGTNTGYGGVLIFDLAEDPDKPKLLANAALPHGYIHDIYVRDNIGYCSHEYRGLAIYDFTDPSTPIELGGISDYPDKGYNHSSWLSDDGRYLVFADETHGKGLKIADVRDPQNIEIKSVFHSNLLGLSPNSSIAHNPFVRGKYAFVSYYHDGLQVFDISDPASPVQAAWYDTSVPNANYNGYDGAWGIYPFFESGIVIASDTRNGMFVLRPTSLELPPLPRNIAPQVRLSHDTLFASGGNNFQWLRNGQAIAGATGATYLATATADYAVESVNVGGCTLRSDALHVKLVETHQLPDVASLGIYPSQTISDLYVSISSLMQQEIKIELYDALGQRVLSEKFTISGYEKRHFDLSALHTGIYFCKVSNGKGKATERIFKYGK